MDIKQVTDCAKILISHLYRAPIASTVIDALRLGYSFPPAQTETIFQAFRKLSFSAY